MNRELFDFPIIREKYINSKGKDTFYDSILRVDDGTSLGVVSRDYKLLEHKDAVDMILENFQKKRISIEPVSIEVSSFGARLFASFRSKNEVKVGTIEKEGRKVGDIVSSGFTILNSYDRSIRFALKPIIYRLVCLNGAVTGEEFFSQGRKHTQGLDPQGMVDRLVENFKSLEEQIIPAITRMGQQRVTPKVLQEELNRVPGWVQSYSIEYLESNKYVSVGEDDEGNPVICIEKEISKWELMNAFTYVLTHASDISPERRYEANQQVMTTYWDN